MSEQKIVFHNRVKDPFTMVDNRLARLKSLSYEAKGLYLTLKSFGATIYPSIKYLMDLGGGIGKNRLYKILDELIKNKLIIRRQTRGKKGFMGKTEYILLSLDDNYAEIYKEFIGEEPENQQTLDNTTSYPCPQNRDTDNRDTDFETQRRIIDKEDLFKEKEKHTRSNSSYIPTSPVPKTKGVCENKIEKIKSTKTFQDTEPGVIENLLKMNGTKAVIAAQYIEKAFDGRTVRNPVGLLISTLRNGLYCELPAEKGINGIKADIEKLNMQYLAYSLVRKPFPHEDEVYENEKITEILNIGGRIAYRTNDITKDMVITPAKSYEEFVKYLNNKQEANNTS